MSLQKEMPKIVEQVFQKVELEVFDRNDIFKSGDLTNLREKAVLSNN